MIGLHLRIKQLLRLPLLVALLLLVLVHFVATGRVYTISLRNRCSDDGDTAATSISLIFVGNPGAGKSFLCNVLLGKDYFKHAYQQTGCTTDHGSASFLTYLHGEKVKVITHNVPGLIDPSNSTQTEINKQFIKDSFAAPGLHIIGYVFGEGPGGRLVAQDIAAYHALKEAYDFKTTSVIIVRNQVKMNRPSRYDNDLIIELTNALNWPKQEMLNLCLIEEEPIAKGQSFDFAGPAAARIRLTLLDAMERSTATRHQQVKEIMLAENRIQEAQDRLNRIEAEIRDQGVAYEILARESAAAVDQFRRQLENAKRQIEEMQNKKGKDWWKQLLPIFLGPVGSKLADEL